MADWYADGLRFECTACGRCCGGAPGVVWVDREEIRRIAAHLAVEPEQLWGRVIRRVGIGRVSLIERANGDCVFLKRHEDGRRTCAIYRLRPQQCRTWPFWASNLGGPDDWAHAAAACPGINAGPLYTARQIDAIRRSPPWHRQAEEQRHEAG